MGFIMTFSIHYTLYIPFLNCIIYLFVIDFQFYIFLPNISFEIFLFILFGAFSFSGKYLFIFFKKLFVLFNVYEYFTCTYVCAP